MFYEDQKMSEILQDKTIDEVKDLLFPPNFFDWIYDDNITPKVLAESFKGVGNYAKRLDFLKAHIDSEDIKRDKLYSQSEIQADKAKESVQVLKYIKPDSDKVAVIIPGGGYCNVCSYSEGWPIAQEMWGRGYNCFVVYYRISPDAIMPKPIEDVACLIKYIMRNYPELNMSDYLLTGFSAGGHLAGIWATKQGYFKYNLPKPKYLSLIYPVIDLSFNKGVSKENCLGKNCTAEDLAKYSVYTNVDENYPETYLLQGKNDQCIMFENSVIMDKALTENNVKHKYVVYDDAPHGFGVGIDTCAEGWIDDMLEFFNKKNEEKLLYVIR